MAARFETLRRKLAHGGAKRHKRPKTSAPTLRNFLTREN
jgi:hypothetical protein